MPSPTLAPLVSRHGPGSASASLLPPTAPTVRRSSGNRVHPFPVEASPRGSLSRPGSAHSNRSNASGRSNITAGAIELLDCFGRASYSRMGEDFEQPLMHDGGASSDDDESFRVQGTMTPPLAAPAANSPAAARPQREPAERSTGAAASSSSEAEQSDEEAAPAEFDASVPLDESEREALQKRVGSALLCRDDALRCRVKGLEDIDAALLARAIVSGGDAARLSAIDLSFNRLTDAGAAAAAAIVAAAPTLATLAAQENQIGDAGGAALARALVASGARHLATVKLSWNSIGDAGMAALAAAVGAAPALTELRLDANRIGDAGATALAHALAARPTPCGLRVLSFGNERGGNAIGDDGLVALVEVLFSSTPELRELGLSNNRIGTAGATALANALSLGGAASLQRAQLQHNAIGAAGLAALAAARADRGSAELSIALGGQRTPLTTGGGGVIVD